MPRRKTAFLPGQYYHLYNRGNNRQKIFFERDNYLFFLRRFRHYLVNSTLNVNAYCLMPNHYHFLVHLCQQDFSQKMQAFTLSYTKAMNKRYRRCGSIFQGRFQAILVNSDAYLLHLSRYIHLNPVEAGLVKRPEDWEFSSYVDYVGLRQGTLPKMKNLLAQVGSADAYQHFTNTEHIVETPEIKQLMLD
ncbi:REP-associated tyrosine transposase [Leptothoe spongobia]|uniref:Transposase n=1 Tax=Leptothoe spongobia TAU-MAC 1115 TaxID=1967444 RepID=A0A947DGV4_9CYAN|nr:transposase [Leptothoe spongobia]MBT9316817.1 transposase [Leptothoe spongobia TAU-MAC 1115]